MDQETEHASAIDLRLDKPNDSEAQVDASVYTLAAVFGPVAFPVGTPEFLKQGILDRADRDRDAAGDIIIDNRTNPDDARRRQVKTDQDDDDNLAQFAQLARQEREERERQEWSHTRSTVGGVTMTGAEWAQFADRLRTDENLHRRLIEAFAKRGMTHDEAESRYKRVVDVAEIASIPEGERTEEQTATFERAKADSTFAQDMKVANDADRIAQTTPSPQATASMPSATEPTEARRTVVTISGPSF